MTTRLSVLDQSPIISGHTPAAAVRATVELAKATERLGYHRYWLAEHHAMKGLADPCPEILLGHVAAATSHMRVGTGGVMLPYYSPLKVAEVFRMHEALHPGRIDLGIGRAPGGNLLTAQALNAEAFLSEDRFPVQVQELVGYLDDCLPPDYRFHVVKAMPAGETSPEVWLLGSSDYSGALASYLGLRFSFAHFISAHGAEAVMRAYRDDFRPTARVPAPYSMLAVFVICAQTREEAERLATSIDLRRLQMARGFDTPIPTVEEALAYPYTTEDRAIIQRERARAIVGTPEEVRERLLRLKDATAADELMVVTITGDYRSRLRSYELLAAAFGLGTAFPVSVRARACDAAGTQELPSLAENRHESERRVTARDVARAYVEPSVDDGVQRQRIADGAGVSASDPRHLERRFGCALDFIADVERMGRVVLCHVVVRLAGAAGWADDDRRRGQRQRVPGRARRLRVPAA